MPLQGLMIGIALTAPMMALGPQSATQAPAEASRLPVSMERIRAALQQPPPLNLSVPSTDIPTFRLEVREQLFVVKPTEEKPFDPTFGLPSLGELFMDGVAKIHSAVVDYKHGRAERRARSEVDDALAAFCAERECPAPASREH